MLIIPVGFRNVGNIENNENFLNFVVISTFNSCPLFHFELITLSRQCQVIFPLPVVIATTRALFSKCFVKATTEQREWNIFLFRDCIWSNYCQAKLSLSVYLQMTNILRWPNPSNIPFATSMISLTIFRRLLKQTQTTLLFFVFIEKRSFVVYMYIHTRYCLIL